MDGRVSPETLLEIRKQVINFYKKGMKLKEISGATGLCWKAVRNAVDLYEQRGVKGLKPGRRGRPFVQRPKMPRFTGRTKPPS